MSRLVLVAPELDLQIARRLDPDIDVLGKTLDDAKAFRERRSAFQFETKSLCLQPPQAMHDPVILLDQRRIDAALLGHDGDQLTDVVALVQKLSHAAIPPPVF